MGGARGLESRRGKGTDCIGLAAGGAVPGGVVHSCQAEAGWGKADGVHQPLTVPTGQAGSCM